MVLGLVSAFVLWFLAGGLMAFADVYGSTYGLGGIAAVVGLIAAGFGAMSAVLWKRTTSGKLVATVFVSILAVAAIMFAGISALYPEVDGDPGSTTTSSGEAG